jgi:hypothetical protein
MTFTNLDKVQNIDVSSALHCTVVPNMPKIPEPIIPPFPPVLPVLALPPPPARAFAIYIFNRYFLLNILFLT